MRKRIKRILMCFLICLALAIVLPLFSYGMIHFFSGEEPVPIEKLDSLTARDAAIVPGTSRQDGSITAKGEDRLDAAIRLYRRGLVRQIIVSGEKKETKPMARYLMRKGIPKESLANDPYGIDTYETVARAREKYPQKSFYFCTQDLYSSRAGYLMERLGLDGRVVTVDATYYSNAGKNRIREFFAATKAFFEPLIMLGKAKNPIEQKDFGTVEKPLNSSHFVYEEEVETPEDCKLVDENPGDDYDVEKAVAYARTYAFKSNPQYGQFEQNCTNFVSQCLVAGGIPMEGKPDILEDKRWNISDEETAWYSGQRTSDKDGLPHYSMSRTFIKTDSFFKYFTEKRGYSFSKYDNNFEGNMKCFQEMAAGDVLVLYKDDGTVAHLGLVSGVGDRNAYYCANTMERRDFSVFTINQQKYSKMGLLHMSKKQN